MDDRDQNIAPGPSQKVHTHTHNTEPIKLSLVVNKKDNGASRHEEKSQGGWWKVFAWPSVKGEKLLLSRLSCHRDGLITWYMGVMCLARWALVNQSFTNWSVNMKRSYSCKFNHEITSRQQNWKYLNIFTIGFSLGDSLCTPWIESGKAAHNCRLINYSLSIVTSVSDFWSSLWSPCVCVCQCVCVLHVWDFLPARRWTMGGRGALKIFGTFQNLLLLSWSSWSVNIWFFLLRLSTPAASSVWWVSSPKGSEKRERERERERCP